MANVVDELTERLLQDAGVVEGMSVLDVGCGRGDVTLLAARRVGESGKVVGVDKDAPPLAAARDRARELALSNVEFVEAEVLALPPDLGPFDAIVGRRVLMYLKNPVEAVHKLAHRLKAGGVMIFQEHDSTILPAGGAALPLHDQVHRWIWSTVEREGANVHMGLELLSVLARAGLDVERVRAEAVVQTPKTSYVTGTIVRTMLPRIVKQGVATEEEIGVDTLDARLAEERRKADATCSGELVFGAWARKAS